MLPRDPRCQLLDDLRCDVGHRIGPCKQADVFVHDHQQPLGLRDGGERGLQLQDKGVLGLLPHAQELGLRVLDEAPDVDLKPVDLALTLLSGCR